MAEAELKAARQAGDAWLWIATDADTKLVPSWFVGSREVDSAIIFMEDLASRLANRVQLTSDGHRPYFEAVEGAFGADIDYAMLVKIDGTHDTRTPERRYAPAECIGCQKQRLARSLLIGSSVFASQMTDWPRGRCCRQARSSFFSSS